MERPKEVLKYLKVVENDSPVSCEPKTDCYKLFQEEYPDFMASFDCSSVSNLDPTYLRVPPNDCHKCTCNCHSSALQYRCNEPTVPSDIHATTQESCYKHCYDTDLSGQSHAAVLPLSLVQPHECFSCSTQTCSSNSKCHQIKQKPYLEPPLKVVSPTFQNTHTTPYVEGCSCKSMLQDWFLKPTHTIEQNIYNRPTVIQGVYTEVPNSAICPCTSSTNNYHSECCKPTPKNYIEPPISVINPPSLDSY